MSETINTIPLREYNKLCTGKVIIYNSVRVHCTGSFNI